METKKTKKDDLLVGLRMMAGRCWEVDREPATEKQIGYLAKLMEAAKMECSDVYFWGGDYNNSHLTRKRASKQIEMLIDDGVQVNGDGGAATKAEPVDRKPRYLDGVAASPMKLQDGSWGAWINTSDVIADDFVMIKTRAGKEYLAGVEDVVWQGTTKSGKDGSICDIVTARDLYAFGDQAQIDNFYDQARNLGAPVDGAAD